MNPRAKATSRLLQETDRAIVTEWRFAPGAETGCTGMRMTTSWWC